MRYDDVGFQTLVSAEYVLGLLSAPVRRRFERLMAERGALRDQVAEWETCLTPLALSLTPIKPPARIWRGIEARLDLAEPARPPKRATPLWPALAAALAVVSLALGVLLLQPAPLAPPTYLAVVNDQQGQPVWLVQTTPQTGELRVQAVGAAAPPAGRDHELWLLPGGDEAPISMGLLPGRGTITAQLPSAASGRIPAAGAVAVSLEPAGGSPTGAPTGPVLYVASLIKT